jgi:hypothetical protein
MRAMRQSRPVRWTSLVVLVALGATPLSSRADPPAATQVAVAAQEPAAPVSGPSWLDSPKKVGLDVGIVGVVGLGVGTVFGILSVSTWAKVNDACGSGGPTQCVSKNPASVTSDHDTAQTEAVVSTVSFILGGVLIASGAAIYLTGVHPAGGADVALAPTLAPGRAGLALSGAF